MTGTFPRRRWGPAVQRGSTAACVGPRRPAHRPQGLRVRLAAAACALVACPAPVESQEWSPPPAPLASEEGSPIQRLGYTPMTEGADPVPEGTFQADLWLGYSNVWEKDSTTTHHLYMDFERLLTALTVRYGLSDGLEVGGRLTLETTSGGFLDPVVEGLHGFLNFSSRNRERYPRGEYQQYLELEGERVLEVARSDLALEDVRLFAKWSLYGSADGGRALSVRGVARVPIRSNVRGPERTDLAAMLLGRTRWGALDLHGMLGASSVRRAPEMREVLNPAQLFLMMAAGYRVTDRWSLLVQFSAATQILGDVGDRDLDLPPMNTVVGLAWRPAPGWRLEAAVQEDTPPWGPSVDFTLQLGLSRTW